MNIDIESKFKLYEYEKGQVLFKEGSLADAFYLIKSGNVKTVKLDKSRIIPLFESTEGDVIAEDIVFKDLKYYSYSSICVEDSLIYKIPKSEIFTFLNSNSEWIGNILYDISNKLSKTIDTIYEHKIINSDMVISDDQKKSIIENLK
ncbi:MAG: Crp/Fnr family transcriptional regulator [Bacteriovoracaceae bacterium]|jgi:CRP-like cAMP-binding protein|nr:Crp/Fnr family transcriptional regulator [Bacteriovoracaceae bacterium]